jgi:hypothetical protein
MPIGRSYCKFKLPPDIQYVQYINRGQHPFTLIPNSSRYIASLHPSSFTVFIHDKEYCIHTIHTCQRSLNETCGRAFWTKETEVFWGAKVFLSLGSVGIVELAVDC